MTGLPAILERSISGISALRTATRNPYGRFPYAANDPHTAGWRIKQPALVKVNFTPKFSLSPADAVFTMGSCFARNVEDSLIKLGVRTLLADFDFPLHLFDQGHSKFASMINTSLHGFIIRSVLNKYSPLSMLNEFQRLLKPELFKDPFKGLIQVDERRWFDPHIKNTRTTTLDDCLTARATVDGATAKVMDATTVFLTLGYTETWLDSETGFVLNVPPAPLLIKKWPDRFRFFNATHGDVLDSLEQIVALLTARVSPHLKFVVTVSPVPLGTTFTEMDIISANSYSKAALRSAVGEFCQGRPNVDYFPSYEMVTMTDPNVAWQEDRVHPTVELVDGVIGHFVDKYFGAPAAPGSGERPAG